MAPTTTTSTRTTRGASGITKPRILQAISTEPEGGRRTATKKKKATTTKANTSKPRSKVTTGRVTKAKKNPVAKAKDKVTGAGEKIAGTIERKPGKKASGTAKMKGTKKPVKAGTKTKTTKKA